MSSALATAIGPFIGILLFRYLGFHTIVAFCSTLSVVGLLIGCVLQVPEADPEKRQQQRGFSLSTLLERRVVPICSVMFLLGVCFSAVMAFLNIFAEERQLAEAASFFFFAYAVTLLASRPFTGRLLDSHGSGVILYPGFVCFALGLVLLGIAESGVTMWVSAVLCGLGFGNMQSSIQAIVLQMVERDSMGLATSTDYIFGESGLGFGPYVLGLLVPVLGYGNLYLTLGAVVMLGLVGYRLFVDRGCKKSV